MRGSMTLSITLVSPDPQAVADMIEPIMALAPVTGVAMLAENAVDLSTSGDLGALRTAVDAALKDRPVDACVQPTAGRKKRLLVADMDSTIIGCECLDELADFAGVKAEVSAITERAMRGELEFEGALRERVAMLKGLPLDALQTCYDERVRLNPGARTLVRTMTGDGARCLLVSGGFTFFTSRVAEAAGFDEDRANRLIDDGGALTGEVADPILGREAKLSALREETKALGIDPSLTLAVGDGANDLAMIEAAGLGVAYRAKPVVSARAQARIDHSDLTALLYFQGYSAGQFKS
ncbi:MAG: phosphoserine phosphatase SerB [Caulobacter sp.]|nr:phosphoserine phosphatase SerB [Caulobacter sp.]